MLIILGILGFLMIVGSLLLLIFKKTENNSKKRLLISIVILGIIFFLISASLRDTSSHETSKVSEKNPILDVKTNEKAAVTADQLKKIKLGDSYEKVVKVLGYPKEVGEDFTWKYDGENSLSSDAYAIIEFDLENKVDYIEQSGITSKDTTGIDEDGINNFSNPEKSTGYYKEIAEVESTNDESEEISDRYYEIKSTIENIIDEDFMFTTSLKEFQLNKNAGTDDPDDYIALIYLSYDELHSAKTTKKWIDEYTSHLAAILAEKEPDITSLSIFWETPRFKEDWNTAKFNLTKKDGTFYFDSKNYDKTVFK